MRQVPAPQVQIMSTHIYVSPEDLRKRILSALDEAEKRAKARTLPRSGVFNLALVEAVASRPWGYAHGDGGKVPVCYRYKAETTYLTLAWYSWRGQKHVYLSACRDVAGVVSYGSSGYLSLGGTQAQAYAAVLPDRARRHAYLRTQRSIRDLTRHLPPIPAGLIVYDARGDGGLVLAHTSTGYIIGTPAGWIRAPRRKSAPEKRPAWNYLSDLGFPVPHRKAARIWTDELTAHAAMHVLGGEQA